MAECGLYYLYLAECGLYVETLCGPVWPLCFYRDWPLVALNPYRSAVLYDEYLSNYFVLNMSEINMSCRLIFSSNETFNLLVCSRCEFS